MRSWLLIFPLAAMASIEPLLKARQDGGFCSTWKSCTQRGQDVPLTTYCRSILSMSDQTSTITRYDSRTIERTTITTSLAVTTTSYAATVTTTSTFSEATSGVYVYTSTVTTVTTRTTTVSPTITTMTTQAPDATQVVSRCLAPGVVQKRELVEDRGLLKRQASSSSVPIPACFLLPWSIGFPDGRFTVTTLTAGRRQQYAVCTSCASVTPFTSTTTERVTTPTTITSTRTIRVTTSVITVTSGTSTKRTATVLYGTTVTYSLETTKTATNIFTITGTGTDRIQTTVTKTLSPTSTTYTLTGAAASPTFYIANENVLRRQIINGVPDYGWHYVFQDWNKQVAGGNVLKFVRGGSTPPSGAERFQFYVNPSGTSLTGTLYTILGNGVAGENPIEYTYPNGTKYRYYEVALFNPQAPATLSIPTVACRYSGGRFSTCPMRCWWTGDGNETTSNSLSQGSIDGPWYIAKPGQVSQSTYPLYAIN